MSRKKAVISIAGAVIISVALAVLYEYGVLPHRRYTSSELGIDTYISAVDKDGDGIDDQTDILKSVRGYIATKPKYKSSYYATGYPDDGYGVCTEVVAFGLRGAGYDLMELVDADIAAHKDRYDIETADKNIDFRRVRNLDVYFKNNYTVLTTDLSQTEEWQGGDIVVFRGHIGIVSDMRNRKGIPFLLHHGSTLQLRYEDVLERYAKDITAHYRIG